MKFPILLLAAFLLAFPAMGQGVITPATPGAVIGTATNDSAAVGYVGELVSNVGAVGDALSLSTNTTLNVTSISLTTGDWDVEGNVNFSLAGATATAFSAGVTTTSATIPTDGTECYSGVVTTAITGTNGITIPRKRVSLTSTTQSVTGTASSDVITATAHGYSNGQPVYFTTLVGGAGLSASTIYYVRDINPDTASLIAGKARTALAADTNVAAFFTVSGATTDIILTAKTKAANDATMNMASDNGTAVGITPAASSANTTAGVAPVAQVETATVAGTIVDAGNASVIVTAAGMTGTPVTVSVAVAALDDASAIAGKIRTALGLNANISAWFTISGATDKVILTAKAAAANDGTMNIAVDNDTCTGIVGAASSANTTAGNAGTLQVETATITGTITTSGTATIIVTAAGMTGSPRTVTFSVAQAGTYKLAATSGGAAIDFTTNITEASVKQGTVVYLVGRSTFSLGTQAVFGSLSARRTR